MEQKLQVYRSIAAIIGKLAKDGISKLRKNNDQGFMFRGIDDVYNALAVHLAEEQLAIIPFLEKREARETTTQRGGLKTIVTVEVRYEIVSAVDGSTHLARMAGEAMDTSDKATNKAMSAAYKYLCLQTFCIPTEGDNDADAHHEERAAAPAGQKVVAKGGQQASAEVEPSEDWKNAIAAIKDGAELRRFYTSNKESIDKSPALQKLMAAQREQIKQASGAAAKA